MEKIPRKMNLLETQEAKTTRRSVTRVYKQGLRSMMLEKYFPEIFVVFSIDYKPTLQFATEILKPQVSAVRNNQNNRLLFTIILSTGKKFHVKRIY